ncbi:YcfL family protein [Aeromonas simiae]|uniref:YcfL family protein n=1 Tax=Aeromonas simiae TaxID=218936 RepID=UPI00266B7893|nr:YcfL family protein [Aeromonas simiae]MDO2949895.1 YcfL family protein [Aeromonas simiae]MDO2957269.1 YcfL family protein [Aeromonas simiae]
MKQRVTRGACMAGMLLTALLMAGCSADTRGVWMTGYSGQAAQVQEGLDVRLTERARTRENGVLKASVEIGNLQRGDRTLQYQFTWFDGQGQEVAVDARPWQPLALHGHQTRTLTATAPQAEVVSYRLYVREVLKESY